MSEVASPCIRRCGLHQQLCMGCGRSLEQIRAWKGLDNPARRAVLVDAERSLAQLQALGLRRYPE